MVADDYSGRSTNDVIGRVACSRPSYPEDLPGGANWLERINPQSLETVDPCYVEPGIAAASAGTRCQFERLGEFCVDPATVGLSTERQARLDAGLLGLLDDGRTAALFRALFRLFRDLWGLLGRLRPLFKPHPARTPSSRRDQSIHSTS